MSSRANFHHGDLRAALIAAATSEIERNGVDNLSLRDLAQQIGVARSAPYRHFESKSALLNAVADVAQEQLYEAYASIPPDVSPMLSLRRASQAYLDLTRRRPRLFQLVFVERHLLDEAGSERPQPKRPALALYKGMVADAMPGADEAQIEATTLACWSAIHGFAMLRMMGRLQWFSKEGAEEEMLDRMLKMVDSRPRS